MVHSNAGAAEAPQDCLKGRYFCHKLTEEDLHKGVAHFNAALAQDPKCAFAYAGLADAYCLSALLNMAPAAEIYPRAKEMALNALRARQDLGDAHASLASVKRLFEWDWAGAEAEYLTALVLSYNSAMVHQAYGAHLAATGKIEEALRELRRSGRNRSVVAHGECRRGVGPVCGAGFSGRFGTVVEGSGDGA